ncbi:DUF5677 domain-containing protein [Thioalkalivibrio sp. ALE16]|uniref:DUF5677 domain-containing protein n=1 Tax=Thioalkalivibrio sp. ALE16 TaxID=1158172 RepID=UPI0012DEDFC0|nr:DUF5677 domain-containing protein [Thioalkalivibrio sp. ALE16]
MSLDETLFIGNPKPRTALPLDRILEHYAIIRDAIATTEHVVPEDLPSFVVNQSFIYAFNSYKAISLLLPELCHESAAAVMRQLWEGSLNLHWVGVNPGERSRDFCNYTVMEYRKLLKKAEANEQIDNFDEATARFQGRFKYQDKKKICGGKFVGVRPCLLPLWWYGGQKARALAHRPETHIERKRGTVSNRTGSDLSKSLNVMRKLPVLRLHRRLNGQFSGRKRQSA